MPFLKEPRSRSAPTGRAADDRDPAWPALTYPGNEKAIQTLQLWTQVVGKIRLGCTPWLNHSWHVPLYVSVRGLSTGLIPYPGKSFQAEFDLTRHQLELTTTAGERETIELAPRSVADFYAAVMAALGKLGIEVTINEKPNEVAEPIPFSQDTVHATYDPDYAHALWGALVQLDRVFNLFRTGFLGKSSPVHFFWGSFDLAVTRFSGRTAPAHPGGIPNLSDEVTREAYSHEVSSAGFWPGGGGVDEPMIYAYAYPTPDGFADYPVQPNGAYFLKELGEFVLPYEAVRSADDPDAALIAFLQSTYDAAAELGRWDRKALDCAIGEPRRPRAL